jgi:hypothetical protein
MQLQKNVPNYLQWMSANEGYLFAKTIRTGREQIIELPPLVDQTTADVADQAIIRAEKVKAIAKRRLKFADSLKKEYATVYDQGLQEMKDKLEVTKDWERTQRDQLLHDLINKIERI